MRTSLSLRLRVVLVCAALLALCCALLTLTNNLSANQMADSIEAVSVLPAQAAGSGDTTALPMTELEHSTAALQARQSFRLQSLWAMGVIWAAGLLLIYHLVGRALSPLSQLTGQIQARTARDLDHPLTLTGGGEEVTALAGAFNQMSRRLSEAFAMQRNFSHNAAHEFRTPLAIMKARIGLFRKKGDFRPQAVEDFLGIMEGEVDRLSDMVSSLLELTNLERSSRREPLPAGQLLQAARQELLPLARERQVTLTAEAPSCRMVGDRQLLYRAVFNLMENAVKYTPHGSAVQADTRLEGDRICIRISDQGPGIPPELRRQIFAPFFRIDQGRSRQQGGAGLGLALVQAIAAAHGGSVDVEDRPGGGSCFLLTLPRGVLPKEDGVSPEMKS